MPRADPARSDYCASRHLLRNLDDAAELRRNPLAQRYFADPGGAPRRRDAAADDATAERIRDDVRAALAQCSGHAQRCTPVTLGRMRAALLRCDIDDQPAPAVAAELGLSERQLRRERRAAHDAFVRAFRTARRDTPPASACDVGTVRLAQAVELHEHGQGVLAQSAFASIAAHAPAPERRIEALCLAAEAELDALRYAAAGAHLDRARAVLVSQMRNLGDGSARDTDDHIEFVAWLLRWQLALGAGLAMQPPLVLRSCADDRAHDEPRRALFVRAAAAFAMQRWEVGDGERGSAVLRRALDVVPTLHEARVKERVAVMMADAQLYGLRTPCGADRHRFRAAERLAASHGHVHAMLVARAERMAAEAAAGPSARGRIFDAVMAPFGAPERRELARTLAWSAQCVAQCEANPQDAVASAELVETMVPARSTSALLARCGRADHALAARRHDDARALAQSAYDDAELAGNGRIRGTAARALAAIAFACRRRSEARRYIGESLALTHRYGSPESRARSAALARRLDIA